LAHLKEQQVTKAVQDQFMKDVSNHVARHLLDKKTSKINLQVYETQLVLMRPKFSLAQEMQKNIKNKLDCDPDQTLMNSGSPAMNTRSRR